MAQPVQAKEYVTFDVSEVEVQPTEHWSEKQLRKLVPELEKEMIDLATLSHQVQLVNESKAVKLNADLQPVADGKFKVVLTAEDQKEETVSLNVNNTGNKYSGDWRLSATYMDKNLTGNSDSLGVAYVTSPGHWKDVQQAAVVYRAILPRAGDSLYFSGSWSHRAVWRRRHVFRTRLQGACGLCGQGRAGQPGNLHVGNCRPFPFCVLH